MPPPPPCHPLWCPKVGVQHGRARARGPGRAHHRRRDQPRQARPLGQAGTCGRRQRSLCMAGGRWGGAPAEGPSTPGKGKHALRCAQPSPTNPPLTTGTRASPSITLHPPDDHHRTCTITRACRRARTRSTRCARAWSRAASRRAAPTRPPASWRTVSGGALRPAAWVHISSCADQPLDTCLLACAHLPATLRSLRPTHPRYMQTCPS